MFPLLAMPKFISHSNLSISSSIQNTNAYVFHHLQNWISKLFICNLISNLWSPWACAEKIFDQMVRREPDNLHTCTPRKIKKDSLGAKYHHDVVTDL